MSSLENEMIPKVQRYVALMTDLQTIRTDLNGSKITYDGIPCTIELDDYHCVLTTVDYTDRFENGQEVIRLDIDAFLAAYYDPFRN